jgi:ABC-type nitrate/sulfonate/bicarbonate transport system substrate-binding protein
VITRRIGAPSNTTIRNARDLIGKKVGMNTLGAHAELMRREYLACGGLSGEDSSESRWWCYRR